MASELEKVPQLGNKVVPLSVKIPAPTKRETLKTGLQELLRKGIFSDVTLLCAGQSFPAHRAVLAAQSNVFRETLANLSQETEARQELRLADIDNPEAVKILLDYIYEYEDVCDSMNPHTRGILIDVLKLAQNYQLTALTQYATQCLSQSVTTGNVVELLAICEQFALQDLQDRILSQLTHNKKALAEVASSTKIMAHPKLMQALLCKAAGDVQDEQPKKKYRK